jgi:PTH1 family peptidyl-tRNA hydrolase
MYSTDYNTLPLVIFGIGNPGEEYAKSRHNLGMMCVQNFAKSHLVKFTNSSKSTRYGKGIIYNQDIVVAKPKTFVNECGTAITYLQKKYLIPYSNFIILVDDMDIPCGKIRIRTSGKSGGHNGIRSIIHETGTDQFPRIRIGIGHPPEKNDAIPWVLGDPSNQESLILKDAIQTTTEAITYIIKHGIKSSMDIFNQKS